MIDKPVFKNTGVYYYTPIDMETAKHLLNCCHIHFSVKNPIVKKLAEEIFGFQINKAEEIEEQKTGWQAIVLSLDESAGKEPECSIRLLTKKK